MTKPNTIAVQAEPATTTTTADKLGRPRRMAREPGTIPEPPTNDASATDPAPAKQPKPHGDSKIAGVIALLSREQGASLAELVEATGWLPHTARAALTGLKKKGHMIAKTSREGVTVYMIAAAA